MGGVNLVPFPRLHFFLIAQAPLASKENKGYQLVNVQELVNQAYSPRNFFSNVKPDDGKYMTASLIFRGPMKTQEVDEICEKRQTNNSDDYSSGSRTTRRPRSSSAPPSIMSPRARSSPTPPLEGHL